MDPVRVSNAIDAPRAESRGHRKAGVSAQGGGRPAPRHRQGAPTASHDPLSWQAQGRKRPSRLGRQRRCSAAQPDVSAASPRRLLPAECSHQLRADRVTALAALPLSLLSGADRSAPLCCRVHAAAPPALPSPDSPLVHSRRLCRAGRRSVRDYCDPALDAVGDAQAGRRGGLTGDR